MLLKKYQTGGKAKKYKVESFKEQPKMDVNVTPRFTLKQKKAIKKSGKKGAFLGSYYGSGILGQRFASSEESKKHSKKDVVKGGIFKGLVPKKGAKMLGEGLVGGAVGGYLGHKVVKKIGERRAKAKIEGKWYLGKKLGQLRKKVGLQTGGKVLKIRSEKVDFKPPKKAKAKTPAEDAIIAKEIRDWESGHRADRVGNIGALVGAGLAYSIGKKKGAKSKKMHSANILGGAVAGKQLGTAASLGVDKVRDVLRKKKSKVKKFKKGGKVLQKQSGREFRKGLEKAPDLDNDLWTRFQSGGNMVLKQLVKEQKACDAHGKAKTKATLMKK